LIEEKFCYENQAGKGFLTVFVRMGKFLITVNEQIQRNFIFMDVL